MKKFRKLICVIGKTGSGKSYLVKQIVKGLQRVVILDTLAEYDEEDNFTGTGFQYFYNFESFKAYMVDKANKPEEPLKAICRFDTFEAYQASLRIVYIVGNMTVVVEEISNFSSSHFIDETLEQLIRFGRHKSVSVIGITQRFHDLHLLFRSNLDMVVAFNITSVNDIEYMNKVAFIGEEADKIARLPKYQHLVFVNE